MQGNSVFRAAYAAIFLYFVRRTVRKVQPFRTGGNRFCAFLPFDGYGVMVGSSNSLDKLMPLVSDYMSQKFSSLHSWLGSEEKLCLGFRKWE